MKKKPIKSLLFDVSQQDQINNRANPKLLRVLLSEQTTRLDFGYVATAYYHKGGSVSYTHLTLPTNREV